jgi:choline dehydrogenase-like flavoprotein
LSNVRTHALLSIRRDLKQIGTLSVWPQLSLSEELMRRERVNAISLWSDRPRLPWRACRASVEALLRGRPPFVEAWPPGSRILAEAGEAVQFIWRKLARPHCLSVMLEQTPDPDTRIRPSPRCDRFGQPAVELFFRFTDEDRRRHGHGLRIAADELGLDGRHIENQLHRSVRDGRLDFVWHHLGATRMHADPRLGVVDGDCRAHEVSNLFVAGSSVFPTGGTAPPTLTIVALSLRLAEYIVRHFG